ncbi:MAG: sorbosone dehydrogenase, partial [candidate division NC10 bacterium]|nr:sorbosone dehydrogenase [candidate division NC10 bacterium]
MGSVKAVAMAVLATILLAALPQPASAQQNLEKLKQFKVSGTDLNIPPVPQTGRHADAIRA